MKSILENLLNQRPRLIPVCSRKGSEGLRIRIGEKPLCQLDWCTFYTVDESILYEGYNRLIIIMLMRVGFGVSTS